MSEIKPLASSLSGHFSNRSARKAINANAIGSTSLKSIINNANKDSLRDLAMPKPTKSISSAKEGKIKAMSTGGFTLDEIAKATGVSTSTISKILNE